MHPHRLSISVINEIATNNPSFTLSQIQQTILRRDGILRVDICVTVKEYFYEVMVEDEYFIWTGKKTSKGEFLYAASDKFLTIAKHFPKCVEDGIKVDLYSSLAQLNHSLVSQKEAG